MTKDELKQKAEKWIDRRAEDRDEWYVSEKRASHDIISGFLKDVFDIDIAVPVFVTYTDQ